MIPPHILIWSLIHRPQTTSLPAYNKAPILPHYNDLPRPIARRLRYYAHALHISLTRRRTPRAHTMGTKLPRTRLLLTNMLEWLRAPYTTKRITRLLHYPACMTHILPPPRPASSPLRPHPARLAPHYRPVFAWLTFIALYITLPLALIYGMYALNEMATTQADRASAFYQQTQANH